ncbi:hypothetical protein HC766_03000 [Candidatus Gracilibacteria bacterium]|nr:hypothetical protein [Candidatus Gracilibacteria bacterium]
MEEVNPNSYYPIEVNTLGEKLEHIKTRKNYLLEFIQRAVFIDKEANSNNCSQCITLFYESIINNPSYGYEILNKDPFVKDLLESQNNHIIIMDQKFLKEINWQFNMARGNKFLREGFWNFKTSIDFVKNANMLVNQSQLDSWEIYGTMGGSKMVFGSSVDKYPQDIVAVIKEQNNSGGNSFAMDINKSIKIPFGYSKVNISQIWKIPKEDWIKLINQKITKGINDAEKVFYIDMIRRIDFGEIDLEYLKTLLHNKIHKCDLRIELAKKDFNLTDLLDVYLSSPVSFNYFDQKRNSSKILKQSRKHFEYGTGVFENKKCSIRLCLEMSTKKIS